MYPLRFRIARTVTLSIVFVPMFTHESSAQPFGIAQGTPTSQLTINKEVRSFVYQITPKVSHPDFESYQVLSTPEHGVCKLVALGHTMESDSYGEQVTNVAERITDQISSKYGISRLFNFLKKGSIWKDPNDWSMAVYKNERTYSRYWDKEEKSNLQNGIQAITLRVQALSNDQTYVTLTFEFENASKCISSIRSVNSKVF